MRMLNNVEVASMTVGERVTDGAIMLVKGMVMIFAVLAILMLVLMLMERFFASKHESEPKKKAEKKQERPVVAPVTETPIAPVVEDNGALVAAITAAIAITLAAEQGKEAEVGGFRVVSFKRVGGRSAWNSK